MADRRKLNFATEMDVLADVAHLRAGYTRAGQWSLPQIAFHLNAPLERSLVPPDTQEPTPQQQERLRLIDQWLVDRFATYIETSPEMTPPPDVTDAAIDTYLDSLRRLRLYPHSHATSAFFGPVPIDKWRQLQLVHAAHHLGFLSPTKPPRRRLSFADSEQVIADVEQLRRGHTQVGQWTLTQICWHLDKTTRLRMTPGEFKPNTPEQDARRPMLEYVLAHGVLPPGLPAPDELLPPPRVDDGAIDQLIATLREWEAYTGRPGQHRLFGNLTLEQARRINLLHCANHLSCVLPLGR